MFAEWHPDRESPISEKMKANLSLGLEKVCQDGAQSQEPLSPSSLRRAVFHRRGCSRSFVL